jgi:hypothetical protein
MVVALVFVCVLRALIPVLNEMIDTELRSAKILRHRYAPQGVWRHSCIASPARRGMPVSFACHMSQPGSLFVPALHNTVDRRPFDPTNSPCSRRASKMYKIYVLYCVPADRHIRVSFAPYDGRLRDSRMQKSA